MTATHSVQEHWYSSARRIDSPNQTPRPKDTSLSLLVIHNISLPEGRFNIDPVVDLFTNKLDPQAHPSFADIADLRVSAHLLIDRRGRTIQFVPFNCQAWHAGESHYQGQDHCNAFSIGIELVGTDTRAFTLAQYRSLSRITRALMRTYPKITPERIVGHCDIAQPPGRKTDPGEAFDWHHYRSLIGDLA